LHYSKDDELSIFQTEVEKGQYLGGGKMTFQEFVERWLLDYAELDGNLEPKTFYRYKEILNSRIVPALGYMKIAQLRPVYLNKFYKSLQQDGVRKDGKKGSYRTKQSFSTMPLFRASLMMLCS